MHSAARGEVALPGERIGDDRVEIVPRRPPGQGSEDARIVGDHMSKSLGRSIIIENTAGSNGTFAAHYVVDQPADGTWLWGWDHPSVRGPVGEHARRMLAYGQERGYPKLTTRKLSCTEAECWEMTALAYLVCGANGAVAC